MLSISNEKLSEKLMRQYIPPNELFCKQTDLYSRFNQDGIPTHDASGNEISKCNFKMLTKKWLRQKQLYDNSNS